VAAIALSVSVIFLLHPIQIQAVTYISQRYTSLAAFFYFLALLLYLKAFFAGGEGGGGGGARRLALYIGALGAALLAMKTKEISFTLPFVMALFDLTLFSAPGGARRRLLRLAPFFFIALVIPFGLLLPSIGVMESGNKMEELMRVQKLSELSGISSYRYLLTQAGVIITYIRLVLFPVHRYFHYYFPLADSFFAPAVYIPAAALAAFFASGVLLVIRSVRRRSLYALLAGLGILWFFLTLSVESSVMPIKEAFAERRIYLPSAGLILALVTGVFYAGMALGKRWNVRLDVVKLTALLLLAAALPLGALTYSRNKLWNDEVLLYEEWVRKNPYVSYTHMYLALEYFRRGRSEDALFEFKSAASIDPDSVVIHKNLAKYYFRVGRIDESIAENRVVLALDPEDLEARYNVGVLFMKKGMLEEARAELSAVLGRRADHPRAAAALKRMEAMGAEGAAALLE
jgi:tetratricopeptide (TPR) repeat protein